MDSHTQGKVDISFVRLCSQNTSKHSLLIRGRIAPSSPEAVPVIAHVKALTRMRLRLLEERGPGYGHDERKGRQVKADLQQTSTSAEATSSASSERRGATVSAANVRV